MSRGADDDHVGDGAFDKFKEFVSNIPAGYTIAIGSDVDVRLAVDRDSDRIKPYVDVHFVQADEQGVQWLPLNEQGDVVSNHEPQLTPWPAIERVHIY